MRDSDGKPIGVRTHYLIHIYNVPGYERFIRSAAPVVPPVKQPSAIHDIRLWTIR